MNEAVFLPDARSEFLAAVRFYTMQSRKVAVSFVEEVQRVVELVCSFPCSAQEIRKDIRRMPLRKFPYNLIYTLDDSKIVVLALMHQRRRPEYWLSRLSSAS